ncbi:hypothetical protein LIER_13635 [Lithospermum erythrorhizon]|uniref:Reverse transcriptase Ty1/copia-type domain-containing protein n=1 Tax=Lithospermum erythrorhizon TaxID=34254 RepID=A0AAV3PW57_LITER
MKVEFDMSMVGELKYFLGFQINQMENSIFISQAKYAKSMVKKFGLETSKSKRIPFATHVKGVPIRHVKKDSPDVNSSVEEVAVDSPMEEEEEDDIVMVSYTTSKSMRRTRASVAVLKKKSAALGVGGVNEEANEEAEKVLNVEELEKLAKKRKAVKKGKAKAKRPSTDQVWGSVSKKRKGMVILEP